MCSDRSELFISLDVGTTSVKTALFNASGDMPAASNLEYDLITPREDIIELAAETYWERCRSGIREVIAASGVPPRRIRSIGICSQGETLIALDGAGKPLRNAIVWMDNRSRKEARQIAAELGENPATGQIEIIPTWPVTKILWLRNNEPDVFSKARRYLLVEDYIIYRLTGLFKGEYALYSSSYMLDVVGKSWWSEILDFVGLRQEQLVDLCEPGEVVGPLLPSTAKELGLPQETKVVTGAMDQTAAMVGAGNIEAGVVTETTGSALVICQSLDTFPKSRDLRMAIQYHGIPDKYLIMGWCASGGMTLKWLRDTFFGPERDAALKANRSTYEPLTALAEGISPGSQGLLFFPYMAGTGTLDIDPEVRGVFYGLELHHKRAHFVRAVMESLAFVLRQNLELMAGLGMPCTDVRSLGGGANSRLWNQIKADTMKTTITTMKCPEAASLGVAILQAVALGVHPDVSTAVGRMVQVDEVFHPDPAGIAAHEAAYLRFREIEDKHFARKN